jgi:hypothetical protein
MKSRAVSMLAALVLLTGCSGGSDGDSTRVVDESLVSQLFTSSALGEIAAFDGLVARELTPADLFDNPDPRGPCGGRSPELPLDRAVGRAHVRADLSVVQIVMARSEEVEAFVEAQLADVREPCGPYESSTPGGATQRVSDLAVTALPDGRGYSLTATIEAAGQRAFTGGVLAQGASAATFVIVASQTAALAPADVEGLADIATAALAP